MAITPRAVGTWAVSNATTQTVTLPTHVAGDMLIVRTIRKPFTNPNDTVINTTGWTAVGTGVANGSTASGNGTGSMGFKAFYKIAESASETNPVVTWGTTSTPGACVAVSYQKGSGEAWDTPVGTGGGDATARTSQTSTMSSHISVRTNDLVDFFRGQCDDSGALTVPTITQTGVTYNTVTEYPATALLDGTSNDIAADGGYRTATAGTSSAAAVITGTSAASEQHGAWMTRLRVGVAGSFTANAIIKAPQTFTGGATVASDDFSEANNTDLNGKALDVGGTWTGTTAASPANEVQSGRAEIGNGSYYFEQVNAGYRQSFDISTKVRFPSGHTADLNIGLIVRCNHPSAVTADALWIGVRRDDAGAFKQIYRTTWKSSSATDTSTSIATAVNVDTDYTLKVEVRGSDYAVYLDGVLIVSFTDSYYTDPAYTYAGMGNSIRGSAGGAGNGMWDDFLIVARDGLTADAVLSIASTTVNGSFTANAVIRKEQLSTPGVASDPYRNGLSELTGDGGTLERQAQAVVYTGTVTSVDLMLRKKFLSVPSDDLIVEIVSSLGGTVLAGVTVPAASIPQSPAIGSPVWSWLNFAFASPVAVSGTWYISIRRTGTSGLYETGSALNTPATPGYSGGKMWYRDTTWQEVISDTDLSFVVYGTGTLVADAVITRSPTATLAADAVLKKTEPASLTADASISILGGGSLTANAVVRETTSATFTADAVIRRLDQPGSFTADAVARRTQSGSFTADARLVANITRYIAPGGNDTTGDGSIGSPWASIQKFIDQIPGPGSTLYLRGGTYNPSTQGGYTARDTYGNLIGTADAPITIRNYPGETPSFPGATSYVITFWPNETSNTIGCNYVVLDGIRFPGNDVTDTALIVVGGFESTFRLVKNITIRNCYFSFAASGTTANDHHIGIIHNAENVTVEGNEFIGTGVAATGGCAIAAYSTPAPIGMVVRRNTFEDFANEAVAAVQVYDYDTGSPDATIDIKHNTFIGNAYALDLRYHSTALVQDNAFDGPNNATSIYDPNNSGSTTLDHNFFSQTFIPDYILSPGSTGLDAASDGSDAGAKQTGGFTADAVVKKTTASSFTANAIVKKTVSGSLTANAVLRKTQASSFSMDAYIVDPQVIWSDDFERSEVNSVAARYAIFNPSTSTDFGVDGELYEQDANLATNAVLAYGHPAAHAADHQFDFYVPAVPSGDTFLSLGGWNINYLDVYVENEGDNLWAVQSAFAYVEFTPDLETWYTAKSRAVFGLSEFVSAVKVWKRGDPEPDWQDINQQGDLWDPQLFPYWDVETGRIDNLTIWALGPGERQVVMTADAVIAIAASTVDGSFTADAIILRTASAGLTANAVIKATIASSLTADSILRRTASASLTADAVIRVTSASSFTASAVIKRTATATFLSDAVLRRTQSGSLTGDSLIQLPHTESLVSDAVIRREQVGSFTAGAFIQGSGVFAFSVDAVLFRTQTHTFDAEAIVSVARSATLTADAVRRAIQEGSIAADAVTRKIGTAAITADAVILAPRMAGFGADAVFLSPRTHSLTANAVARRSTAGGLAGDAVLKASVSSSLPASATVRRTQTANLTADAVARQTVQATLTGFAVIRRTGSGSLSADAFIVAPGSGESSLTANAVLRASASQALTANAIARIARAGSFVADAYLLAARSASLTANAVIKRTVTGSLTANAVRRTTSSATFTTDAYVRTQGTGSLLANAVLRATRANLVTTDAVLRATRLETLTADSVARRTSVQSLSVDAFIVGGTTGSITANAILRSEVAGSLTADAVVTAGEFPPIDASIWVAEISSTLVVGAVDDDVESVLFLEVVSTTLVIEPSPTEDIESSLYLEALSGELLI